MLIGKALAKEILNAINSGDKNNQEEMWLKISEAIIKYIQTNAVVSPISETPMMSLPGVSGGQILGTGKIL